MNTRNQAIQACLSFGAVYEDYPFDTNWTAMRHNGNGKCFAYVYQRNDKLWLNVKTLPEMNFFWRQQYPNVTTGYHMNKKHWITVPLDDSLPNQVVVGFIADSFELTKPKTKASKQ